MIFATQTQMTADRFGLVKGTEMLCQAGYPAIDFSISFVKEEKDLPSDADLAAMKETAARYGAFFNQAHAPFGYQLFTTKIMPFLPKIFAAAAKVGARQMVIHPLQPGRYYGREKEIFDLNADFYRGLAPLAKEYGVKVAIENMWQYNPVSHEIVDDICADPRELADLYDAVDDPDNFTVCLDIGHVPLCNREPEDAVRILGHDRLGALHVHDVDYVNDLHTLPGMGKINWDTVCRALGEIDYKGEFTLEADMFLCRFEDEFFPTALRFMADRARFLAELVDSYRSK